MKNFAIYRMPYADTCVEIIQHEGEPEQLMSPLQLNGKKGFVVAPFDVSDKEPILLIRPDETRTFAAPQHDTQTKTETADDTTGTGTPGGRSYYAIDFSSFHAQLESGAFQKIVLARCAELPRNNNIEMRELFERACLLYPRVFVALVSTEVSGTWLIASPEILLEGNVEGWHTMALAGTMTLGNLQWSEKNICEQAYVTSYITKCIEQFTTDFSVEGPYSVRAGQLVHLRTDFRFKAPKEEALGRLIAALHPTPAVCGIPKHDTRDFIIRNEHTPRNYYSGFMGPLDMAGATHLYVSLRCMQIKPDRYRLYAGGGILADSIEQQEWEETEEKMKTMRNILY